MNITGHDTHSIQSPQATDPSGQTGTTRQRPQTSTQRSGSLSLGELGRRTGRFIGLRQRTGTPPQQRATGMEQPSTSRGLANTANRLRSSDSERRASGAGGQSALERASGRRFESGAVDRAIAEAPARQESDLEQLLADAPPEPTLAELFARSQRLQGRALSDASDDPSGPPSERSADEMAQPPLGRAAGGRFDGDTIGRALERNPARQTATGEQPLPARDPAPSAPSEPPAQAPEQAPQGRLSDVSSLSAHASESSPPRLSSSNSGDQGSPNASGTLRREESSERSFSAQSSIDSDTEHDQPPLDRILANRFQDVDLTRILASEQDESSSSGSGEQSLREDSPPSQASAASASGRHGASPASEDAGERPGWPLAGRFDDVRQLQAYTRTGRSSFSAAADIATPPQRSNSDHSLDSPPRSPEIQRWDSSAGSQASQSSLGSSPDIEHPPLDRTLARRFTGIDVDRIMAYNPARQATSSLEMGLDGKGKLRVGENTPAALRQLLQHTLGQPQRSYLAHHGQPDGDQLLMDKQGTLLHLQQTPAAIAVIRSSRPSEAKQMLDAAQGGRVSDYALGREGDGIFVAAQGDENRTRRDLDVTGRSHLAVLTGIHEDAEGQRLRLHDGKLYHFDIHSQAWTPHPDEDGVPFKQLALQADGRIYALQGDALVDMSADEPLPPIEARDVRSFSVAADGIAALLCGQGDEQRVRLVGNGTDIEVSLGLNHIDAEATLTQVGLTRERLYLTDNEGRLYSCERHEGRDQLSLARDLDSAPGGDRLGKTHFAEGFMQDDQARLNLLIKDPQGHLHSQPCRRADQPSRGSWNLTDALVVDNRRGLPNASPAMVDSLNLGRLGHVALEGGELQRWDTAANAWASTGIKNVERLQLGMDGKPYVLQDGKLLKLDVSPSVGRFAHDGNQSLAPTGQNIKVGLGGALTAEVGDVRAFAMVNDKLFVTLDGEGQLNLHDNGKAARPLSLQGLDGEVRSLALDKQQNLHALSENGTLYRLPRQDWQASPAEQREPSWEALATPDNQPVASARTAHGNTLLIGLQGAEDEELQHDGTTWRPHNPAPLTPPQVLKELFERVRDDNKTWKLGGLTVKASLNRLGRSNVENRHRSGTAEFIRAHVFKPTLETPRPLKNLGYNLQHRWQGREGLSDVYQEEGAAFEKLKAVGQNGSARPAEGEDLKSRIARLDRGEQGTPLSEALETFRAQLEESITQTLVSLGKEKGLLNLHGEPREGFKPPLLGGLKQKLNPFNSGEDLTRQLRDALAQLGSEPRRSAELLGLLDEKGVALAPQKSEIPLGRRRDPSDDSALLKARLALDVTTLHELSSLTEQIAAIPDAPSLEDCSQALSQLRDHGYGDNPLKVVTDMGFRGHDSLEADYDAVKAFLNAFKKTDHAVHINLRGAFGGDSADMAKGLKAAIKEIESDHELHIHRTYGGSASTPTTGPGGPFTFPNGRLAGDRGYSLTFEIADSKLTATFIRQGGGSASVGAAVRERTIRRNHDLGPEREGGFSFPLDAYVKGTLGGNQRNALLFTLTEGEVDQFVDDLMQGKLNPYELMKKGSNHEVQHGYRFNFDIDAGASANVGQGFNLHEKEKGSPFSGVARFRAAVEVNLNLLNYNHHRMTNSNSAGRLQEEGGLNRPRLLNQVEVKGALQAQLIAGHENQKAKEAAKAAAAAGLPEPSVPFETTGINLGVTGSASVDMKTTKRFKFLFKPAQPLTNSDLAKLSGTLGKAFRDKASGTLLKEIDTEGDLDKRLAALQDAFSDRDVVNDDQHAALKSLRQAADRQVAAQAGHNMLDYMRLESTYTNLSRLDEASLLTRLSAELNPNHAQSNSEYIASLMQADPKLEALIKQLQDTPGTTARVRLEFKDEVAAKVDKGSRDGTMTQDELVALLSDRNNMRLRAIMVYQTESKSEGFVSPTPLLGYSSGTSLALVRVLGRVNFDYGRDQDLPKGYQLEGDVAQYDKPTQEAIAALKREGYDVKQ